MKRRQTCAAAVVTAGIFLAACPGGARDEVTEDLASAACVEVETSLSMDEVSALGFSGAELLAEVEGIWTEALVWSAGGGAELTLTVAHAGGDAAFFDAEAAPSDGEIEPALAAWCPDRLEVEVQIGFVTDDGGFDELWSIPVVADESSGLSSVRFSAELDLDTLGGDHDLLGDVQSADYDDVRFWVYGVFEGGASVGEISGQASGEDDCEGGDDCVAWAEQVSVGYWPADLE